MSLPPGLQTSLKAPLEFQDAALPEIATEVVPLCGICGGSEAVPFSSGYDYEIKTCRNRWTFVQCSSCEHIWLNPRPAISTLSVIYPSTYYAYTYKSQINPIAVRAKELLDYAKMGAILKKLGKQADSFLDIGCGDGRFLKVMEKKGVAKSRNFGIELDKEVVRVLANEGYSAFSDRVEDCTSIPENGIDLITMFHVIEHVDQPDAVIKQIVRWLSPGGMVAIETPNVDSLDAHLFKKTFWGGYHFPRHWHLFSPETLSYLLKRNGLNVLGTLSSFRRAIPFDVFLSSSLLKIFVSRTRHSGSDV